MNIAFLGTPDIAKQSLERLNQNEKINIKLVITKEDKPVGRKMVLTPTEVKKYAQENNLEVITPKKVKNNIELIEKLKSLDLDFLVVVAYGKILPKEVLEIPKKAAINLHVSLLPKYRGAAPIQWAVLNGDKKTGITTMLMDETMDTGDILLQEEIPIPIDMTTGELFDEVSKKGKYLLEDTLLKFDKIIPKKQEGQETLAPMLNKELSNISWNWNTLELHNRVRGLNPLMGTVTKIEENVFKIWKTNINIEKYIEQLKNLEKDNDLKNGQIIVLDKKIFVKTKDGFIEILEIQAPNAKRLTSKEFINGHDINMKIFEDIKV